MLPVFFQFLSYKPVQYGKTDERIVKRNLLFNECGCPSFETLTWLINIRNLRFNSFMISRPKWFYFISGRRFSWLMSEIVWRHTICCNAPTLNNPQDLDLDCLAASFQWPAEMRANRLLGSAKPRHVKSSDRWAVKKTDDGYQGQGCPC